MESERKILIHGKEQSVILTDDPARAAALRKQGICCMGIARGNDFFTGVDFVAEDPRQVKEKLLSLAWHRFHRLPYLLFEEGKIRARESIEEDYDALVNILDGYGDILTFPMSRDWFKAYVRDGYRMSGYGIWSVLYGNDPGPEIAGWCGLGPVGETAPGEMLFLRQGSDPGKCRLELGFVIRGDLRRRGIAKKVCREALDYAAEVLGEEKVLIRTDRTNMPAQQLALSLGFQYFSGSGYSSPKVSTVIL